MYILKKGRKSFLDFLRNLTPTATPLVIGAVCVYAVLYRELPTHQLVLMSILGFIFGAVGFAAIYANISLFLEDFLAVEEGYGKIELIIYALIIYFSFVVVFFLAIVGAISALNLIKS